MTDRFKRTRIILASNLNFQAQRIYIRLLEYEGYKGCAYPRLDTLGEAVRLPRRTLTRYLTHLYVTGLVVRDRHRGPNDFTLPEHPLFENPSADMSVNRDDVRAYKAREKAKNEAKRNGKVPKAAAKPEEVAAPSVAATQPLPDNVLPFKPIAPPTDLERAENAWRSAMANTYPKIPVATSPWKATTKPGEHAAELLANYSVEHIEKYLGWVVGNWGSLVKRFERIKGFPVQPQLIWAKWKAEELIGEAMGAVEVTRAQQALDIRAEVAAWRKAHPTEKFLPDDLSARLSNAPKIAGQKL